MDESTMHEFPRRTFTFALAACALLVGFASFAGDEPNRLRNGDFENGGKSSVNDWAPIYPPAVAKPAPTFGVATEGVHGGKRAGSIVVDYSGGYTSLTQSFALSKELRSIHFEAWCRVDEKRAGAASVMVWITVPGHADGGEALQSARISEPGEWKLLTVDASIPEGATGVLARCGVIGPCSATFDDAKLLISKEQREPAKLAVAHGDYRVQAKGSAGKPWVEVSIPFPLGGQTPLALRVTSKPAGRVAA